MLSMAVALERGSLEHALEHALERTQVTASFHEVRMGLRAHGSARLG